MTHGNDITERFLLSQKSILTHYQQVGLANIVEWFGSFKNSREVCFVTTAIGFKYAAMMLWCLPSMLEWADNNQLIPDGAINLKKPLLILCTKKGSVEDLWNMVHSKSAFHQSSLLRLVNTCSDGKSLSYLATDAESACNIGSVAEQYKLVLSDIGCLDDLPKDEFSHIIVFNEEAMSINEVNAVSAKYAQKSNIIYFTAHPVGLMKKFELQKDFPSSSCESDTSGAKDIMSSIKNTLDPKNAISFSAIDVEKPFLSGLQESQEVEFEEECEDIETIILPPDSTPQRTNFETVQEVKEGDACNGHVQEVKEEGTCNVHVQKVKEEDPCNVQESIVSVEETTPVEIVAQSVPDKKKKTNWRRIFKKKAKVQKTQQQNIHSQEVHFDTISAMGHSSENTQPDIGSPQQKKTSKWSKCKKLFHNISSNNSKGRKSRSPPNNYSSSRSHEIAEDIDDENRSIGLFMCWRRKRPNKKKGTSSSSDHCEQSENANRSSDPMTWTDPVTYLSNIRLDACTEDMAEEAQEEDAFSFASVVLSDPSSLDIISLLERDYSENNNMSYGANALDVLGEVENELVFYHDQDEQIVKVLSHESIISHPNAIEYDTFMKTENGDYSQEATTKKT